MTTIELLSPAKNLECGIAAINHGADAVYIGASKFGARKAASNNIQDIEALIKYAHKYYAKVYITINTILFDDELEGVKKIINQLYQAGADALIIQDMGLLELDLPPIPLHASTQTHNYDLNKILFLQNVGFQRLILARELSLKQINNINQNTNIELEYFVHGALCVSFSGQCYFSQAVYNRSANRGECAQPCRLPYSLVDAKGNVLAKDKHLLSMKDLNLSAHLNELIKAGISTFKIEGRLKDVGYVKNITSYYRQKIDSLIETDKSIIKASSGKTKIYFNPVPEKTFSRGFTNYFLHERQKDIVSLNTPKAIGEFIGKVSSVNKDYFVINSKSKLNNGDGICFFNKEGKLVGININNVVGDKIYTAEKINIKEETSIYRNLDKNFTKKLNSNNTSQRKIDVEFVFEETDNGFCIKAKDEDDNFVQYSYDCKKILSNNKNNFNENIKKQISKTGNSIFNASKIEINVKENYFIQISALNNMRREVLTLLEKEREKNYKLQRVSLVKNNFPYPEKKLDFNANILNKKAEEFYKRHKAEKTEPAFELQKKLDGKTIMTTRHCLKYQFGLCPKIKKHSKIVEPLYLVDKNNKYRLEFDCKNCVMKIIK
ncbi:MAG: U32 family peptidase [Bacteroidetes bacterium]|nr:U32 family peptidase [Bacteroidota bacterium]